VRGRNRNPARTLLRRIVNHVERPRLSTDLRSATQGRANYSMEFSHYAEAPNSVAEQIIRKAS